MSWRRLWIRFQPVRPPPPRGVGLCSGAARRRRAGSRRAGGRRGAALLAGLGGHRGTDPGAGDLPLGLITQRQHGLLVILRGDVDPAPDLGHPQLNAVVVKQRCHRGVLAAAEGPLVRPVTMASHPRSGSASAVTHLADNNTCNWPRLLPTDPVPASRFDHRPVAVHIEVTPAQPRGRGRQGPPILRVPC